MIPGDLLSDLPAFVAAVEAGGFAAAAGRLNLTRSAVARTVARLEGRLGVRLFHRTTRSLALTDDGLTLIYLSIAFDRQTSTAMRSRRGSETATVLDPPVLPVHLMPQTGTLRPALNSHFALMMPSD